MTIQVRKAHQIDARDGIVDRGPEHQERYRGHRDGEAGSYLGGALRMGWNDTNGA